MAKTKQQPNKTLIALRKAQTLLSKVITMVESEKYCIDVIQQTLAVVGLLKSANIQLLQGHLGCCFVDAAKAGNTRKLNAMIEEILTIVKTAQSK